MLKKNSLKLNFLMNFIRVFLNVLFPLITFPYVSRILLADGIGKVSFAQGITNYFILLSSLGMSLYGIREVAKVRDNKVKLSQLVFELLVIITISTIISVALFIIFINFNDKAFSERSLFYIFLISIIFTNIGVEWFYQGIEEYRYITLRSIFFKLLSIFMLFTLVKDEADYLIYALILVIAVSGSSILNFLNLWKYVSLKKVSLGSVRLKRHVKPILIVFGFSAATSIYVNLDTVMLGYISGDRSVGLYTAGIRIVKTVVVLVTTLGAVLIPRISYYIEKGLYEEFKRLAKFSYIFTIALGLPAVIGLYILAPDIILIFAGNDFEESVSSMRVMLPIILFLGLSNFIGIQLLYPFGKEKIVLVSVLVGAITNFTLNMVFIPKYDQMGAALATMTAECIVLLVQVVLARKLLKFLVIDKDIFKIFISSVFMGVFLYLISDLVSNRYYRVGLGIVFSCGVYLGCLIVLRTSFAGVLMKGGLKSGKKI